MTVIYKTYLLNKWSCFIARHFIIQNFNSFYVLSTQVGIHTSCKKTKSTASLRQSHGHKLTNIIILFLLQTRYKKWIIVSKHKHILPVVLKNHVAEPLYYPNLQIKSLKFLVQADTKILLMVHLHLQQLHSKIQSKHSIRNIMLSVKHFNKNLPLMSWHMRKTIVSQLEEHHSVQKLVLQEWWEIPDSCTSKGM